MSREECEAKILEKLKEIKDICLEFNPQESHISMCIIRHNENWNWNCKIDTAWYYSAFSVDNKAYKNLDLNVVEEE